MLFVKEEQGFRFRDYTSAQKIPLLNEIKWDESASGLLRESVLGDFVDRLAKRVILEKEDLRKRFAMRLAYLYHRSHKTKEMIKNRKDLRDLLSSRLADVHDRLGVRIVNALAFYDRSVRSEDRISRLLLQVICLECLISSRGDNQNEKKKREHPEKLEKEERTEEKERKRKEKEHDGAAFKFRTRIPALLYSGMDPNLDLGDVQSIDRYKPANSERYWNLRDELKYIYHIRCDIVHRGEDLAEYCRDLSAICELSIISAIQYYTNKISIEGEDPIITDFDNQFLRALDKAAEKIGKKSVHKQ